MESPLIGQYELAWGVADLVATHGSYDFKPGITGVCQVVKLCGLRVYFEHQMPVRIQGTNIDVTLKARAGAVPYQSTLQSPGYFRMQSMLHAEYTLTFALGTIDDLKSWHEQLNAFVDAVAPRKAA